MTSFPHPMVISTTRRIVLLAGMLCATLLDTRAGILDWIAPKHDVQVITVTDTTPAGALLRAATPADPVYYIAISLGYRDLGGIIGGDKIPPKDQMVRAIAKVLAKQGYLPATKAHPPSLVLLWLWGTLYTDRFFDGSDLFPDGQQTNRRQILRFLGGYKMGLVTKDPQPFTDDLYGPGLSMRSADADAIYDISGDDLYVAAIAAFDYRAFAQKKKQMLWLTKISCPARGLQMDETLPTMLAIAGPNIGRETVKPVWINASDKYKPSVQIGDPKVVEYLDKGQLPVIDATSAPAKSNRAPRK